MAQHGDYKEIIVESYKTTSTSGVNRPGFRGGWLA